MLALGVVALAGCGSSDDSAQKTSAPSVEVGVNEGQAAPTFSLERVDGGQLDLADLRGKTVLLDFWDTWCPPCRKALPHLEEISREHPEDFVVVGVALGQRGRTTVQAFVDKGGFSFPFVFGNVDVFGKFGVQGLPTTFLLDKDGVIRKKWVGGYPKAAYEQEITKVLGG